MNDAVKGTGVTDSVATWDAPANVPVMVTGVAAFTAVVTTCAVPDVAPAATDSDVGTVAAELLLDSVTTAPDAGAAADRVAVSVTVEPPMTLVGLSVSAVSVVAGGGGVGLV